MAETKPKQTPSLRQPKPKKTLGLTVRQPLRMPHDDLIVKEPESMPSQTSQTSLTRQGESIAPVKDFARVPNSLAREIVPAGLFKGKSKQLYDCLYSLTRGAVVPAKTVRVSRPKLMKKAGIGSRVTFEANVEHLSTVGLIEVRQIVGEHEGNEYAVFLPEELSMPSPTSMPSLTRHAQKLDRLVRLETSQTRHTLSGIESTTSDVSNTFINTSEKDDDEAFADFVAELNKAARDITGRELAASDRLKLKELGHVLVTELRIAAGRTTVSSVPAFLAEHLRRRLWKKEQRQIEAEAKDAASHTPACKVDASRCPDCFGTGMWYPEGYEKGVARCRHEKLTPEKES